MAMSCNGCRVLRKGCDDDCNLRPCLSWITSPESQANATLFLAKFYGRAGLLNLINAGPSHLRPETFRSLLHEACGRIINPTYGSVGLIWSGNWEQCQAAVDSVLQGSTIMQLPTSNNRDMLLEGCDIRHVSKDHRVKIRNKFKRPRNGSGFKQVASTGGGAAKCSNTGEEPEGNHRDFSHESSSAESVEGSSLNEQVNDDEAGKMLLELTLG